MIAAQELVVCACDQESNADVAPPVCRNCGSTLERQPADLLHGPSIEADTGSMLLDVVHAFLGRFVAYPSEHGHVAHTLWIAHTHLMDAWESTPRIAFLSPEPGSGKTRALEVSELLVPRPVEAVNTTPAYLFRKVSDHDGLPTILYDEIDTVFGPKAKDNEEIRGLLNAGHRRGAMAGRCVVNGKTIETEELPAFCAVALAGLGGLPDTILSRSVIVEDATPSTDERDRAVPPPRAAADEGHALRDALAEWADSSDRPRDRRLADHARRRRRPRRRRVGSPPRGRRRRRWRLAGPCPCCGCCACCGF